MRVSLNWLKTYIDIELSPEKVGEILTEIGLEVEGMEVIESIPGGLAGIVVGEVKTCGRHPNADKLSVTTVDIGLDRELPIVCGAPNVAAGQKVLIATVGTTLHPITGDPLQIKKSKIRGETSEGMICAEDEIGVGHSHEGIMVLPTDTKIGTPARDIFNLQTDYVYEIGLTPNRSDATNHLGVAKDLAAALKINYHLEEGVKMPDIKAFKVDNESAPIEVVVENTDACPRYAGLTISDITIKESPDWLKQRLQAVGVRPINNIVDITNFVLHELGQPLHAFDLSAITNGQVLVKTLPEGSVFKTLDEVDRKLSNTDLMICDGQSKGMCIAGVFGGAQSGVKESTTQIFLESAHFNPKWVRKTSMHYNLRTDAAKVFEKGSDPNVVVYALKRAALLIKELGGGQISSPIIDLYPQPIAPKKIKVRYSRINQLIGVHMSKEEIHQILEAMEMQIEAIDDHQFEVAIPTNKADVLREVDVIEEVLRIYGFNKVPLDQKLTTSMAVAEHPDPTQIKAVIGDLLASRGVNEIMAVSLTESRYFNSGQFGIQPSQLVYVNNTSNMHLDIMRPTMLISGLEAVLHNQNRQQSDLKLFEFGKAYQKDDQGNISETHHLSIFLTGSRWGESWLFDGQQQNTFYSLKAFVAIVLGRLGVQGYQADEEQNPVFSYGMRYFRGPQQLVSFGKVEATILRNLDIRGDVFYADFNWEALLKAAKKNRILFEPLNKFPSTRRDLALVVENSTKFSDIVAIAKKQGKKLLKDINLFDVYRNEEQLGPGKKSYAISCLFEDPSKTLKDKDVDKVMNKMIGAYESQLGAIIRR